MSMDIGNIPTKRDGLECEVTAMLMRTGPFPELYRVAHQVLGTATQSRVIKA
jgi:hypothetical protein